MRAEREALRRLLRRRRCRRRAPRGFARPPPRAAPAGARRSPRRSSARRRRGPPPAGSARRGAAGSAPAPRPGPTRRARAAPRPRAACSSTRCAGPRSTCGGRRGWRPRRRGDRARRRRRRPCRASPAGAAGGRRRGCSSPPPRGRRDASCMLASVRRRPLPVDLVLQLAGVGDVGERLLPEPPAPEVAELVDPVQVEGTRVVGLEAGLGPLVPEQLAAEPDAVHGREPEARGHVVDVAGVEAVGEQLGSQCGRRAGQPEDEQERRLDREVAVERRARAARGARSGRGGRTPLPHPSRRSRYAARRALRRSPPWAASIAAMGARARLGRPALVALGLLVASAVVFQLVRSRIGVGSPATRTPTSPGRSDSSLGREARPYALRLHGAEAARAGRGDPRGGGRRARRASSGPGPSSRTSAPCWPAAALAKRFAGWPAAVSRGSRWRRRCRRSSAPAGPATPPCRTRPASSAPPPSARPDPPGGGAPRRRRTASSGGLGTRRVYAALTWRGTRPRRPASRRSRSRRRPARRSGSRSTGSRPAIALYGAHATERYGVVRSRSSACRSSSAT